MLARGSVSPGRLVTARSDTSSRSRRKLRDVTAPRNRHGGELHERFITSPRRRKSAGMSLPWRERLTLRPKEFAEIVGISRSSAYELIASGRIPSVLIGDMRRVPVEAVKKLVDEQQNA